MLAGLLRPTSGTVTYLSRPITGPSAKIGFIFQNFSLFPWLTVRQNIVFGPRTRGLRPREYEAYVDRLLEVAHLQGDEHKYPHQLSGGMQQRLAIVRALANQPSVLLMDEPFAALDVQTRWQMQHFLIESIKQIRDPATRQIAQRNTIVFVTHDIDEAVYVGDRIYVGTPRPLVLGGADEIRVSFSPEARCDAPAHRSGVHGLGGQGPRGPPCQGRARRRRPRAGGTHPMSRIGHHRPQYPDQFGQFKMSYHLEMVSDSVRTAALFEGLRRSLHPEMVFCELGCGTGIFSIFAAGRCKKVYAVELDPAIAAVARANFERSRFAERIELIVADALDVTLPERVDIAFCEMMSIWTIEEPQVPVANRARLDLLKPGGIFLPSRIVNLAELGHYKFGRGEIVMKATTPLFTGIPRPAVMTECKVCKVLDLSATVERNLGVDIEFVALAAGEMNCARLGSVVQTGPHVVFSGSDSLMPPTVVPLDRELTVEVGQRIRFRVSARARSDMGECHFMAEIVS